MSRSSGVVFSSFDMAVLHIYSTCRTDFTLELSIRSLVEVRMFPEA